MSDSLVKAITEYHKTIEHPAHHREDLEIARLLDDLNYGWYIDIGAHDPHRNSNSHGFYELGWRGVDVEPIPYFVEKLREAHPDNLVIAAAVGDRMKQVELFVPDTEPMHWQIATTKLGWVEWNKRSVPQDGWKTIQVWQTTLDYIFEILEKKGQVVDFISIDVEGAELEVLNGWDQNIYQPKVVCIEAVDRGHVPLWDIWEYKLLPYYNFVHFDGCNRFYVRK